jgi:hypothetical protein
VSSLAVTGSRVMTSSTLRPCVRVYSSASRPGPIRNSSQRGRRHCVPVSARRRKSPSVTMPTRPPCLSITGNPLMRRCDPDRLRNGIIRFNRHHGRRHYILDFHGDVPFQAESTPGFRLRLDPHQAAGGIDHPASFNVQARVLPDLRQTTGSRFHAREA